MNGKRIVFVALLALALTVTGCRFNLFGGSDENGATSVSLGDQWYQETIEAIRSGKAVIPLAVKADAYSFYRFDLVNPKGSRLLSTILTYDDLLASPTFGPESTVRAVLFDRLRRRLGTDFNYFDFSQSLSQTEVDKVTAAINQAFGDIDFLVGSTVDIASHPLVASAADALLATLPAPTAEAFVATALNASPTIFMFKPQFPDLDAETIGKVVFNLEAQKFISSIYSDGVASSPYVKCNVPLGNPNTASTPGNLTQAIRASTNVSTNIINNAARKLQEHPNIVRARSLLHGWVTVYQPTWQKIGNVSPTITPEQSGNSTSLKIYLPPAVGTVTPDLSYQLVFSDFYASSKNDCCSVSGYKLRKDVLGMAGGNEPLPINEFTYATSTYDCRIIVDGVERVAVNLPVGQTSTIPVNFPLGNNQVLRVYGPSRDRLLSVSLEAYYRQLQTAAIYPRWKDIPDPIEATADLIDYPTINESASAPIIRFDFPSQASTSKVQVFNDIPISIIPDVVGPPPTALEITPTGGFVAIGKTASITATAVYADGTRTDVTSQATWSTSNTAIATFIARGTLQGVSAGIATVTVSFNGTTKTGSFSVGAAGYVSESATYAWEEISITGTELLPSGYNIIDDEYYTINLPFTFTFFGTGYTTCYPSTNGLITFGSGITAYNNSDIPNAATPNNFITPLFRDLRFWESNGGKLRYEVKGTAPNRRLIVQWQNINEYAVSDTNTFTFQAILYEGSNDIRFQYKDVIVGNATYDYGKSATVGLENAAGTIGSKYSFSQAKLSNNQAILFRYQTQ